MVKSETDSTFNLETPIVPINSSAHKPAKKRIARMLALDVVQDAASMHCFPAQRKFKSARTLFEAEQCPETVGRWLQGLEEKILKREQNPQQREPGQSQHRMTCWDGTSGYGPSDLRRLLSASSFILEK